MECKSLVRVCIRVSESRARKQSRFATIALTISNAVTVKMSNTATPQTSSGYASPAPSPSPAPRIPHVSNPSKSSNHPKPKPANVFSSDGSFLERFQHLKRVREFDTAQRNRSSRSKQDEDEKKKQEDVLARSTSWSPIHFLSSLNMPRQKKRI